MTQWEYLTIILDSNIEVASPPLSDDIPMMTHPQFTPFSLIPQLNRLGSKGWELINCQPVVVGKKGDVQTPSAAGSWAKSYFCAFKRQV